MELTNIKNYVGYASNNYPTYGVLKSSFFVFLYLCFIASIFSFVSERVICFSILLSVTIAYGIGLLLFQKKCKTPYFILRFVAKGTLGTMYSLVFLLLDFTLLETLGKVRLSYVLSLLGGYIILLFLFLFITVFKVKYNKYSNMKSKSKNSYFLIGFASIAGIVSEPVNAVK
jgi:hypothetical protein